MAPARVRGCAGSLETRLADASRRRSGPRKATSRRPITVRLRGKSCLDGGSDIIRAERRALVAKAPRDPQQADVGTKTRSAGRVPPTEAVVPSGGRRSQWGEGGLTWRLS